MKKTFLLIFSLLFLTAFPAASWAQSSFNLLEGSLVKSPDSTAVYWVGPDEKRHAFPNERIYFSWYQDFSAVKTITAEELASYPLGKNVLYRPGSRMIKIPSVPEVYAVEPFGRLRNIPSEAVAEQLYGEDWNQQIDDIDISFFFDYTIVGTVEVIDGVAIPPVGTVVEYQFEEYIIDQRTDGIWVIRQISDAAYVWNNFAPLPARQFVDGQLPSFFQQGLSILTPEAAFSCVYCDKSAFKKRSIQSTQVYEQDGLRIEVPESFLVEFTDTTQEAFDSPLNAVESDYAEGDAYAENLLLIRWFKEDFGSDINQLLETRKGLANTIFYSGPSLSGVGDFEIVVSDEDQNLFRNIIFDRGSYFYDTQFTSLEYGIDAYIDVLDLMADSLEFPPE
jgi:hypothetical protein